MQELFHRGAPCTPPVVNGVEFEEHPTHIGYWFAKVEEEVARMFDGIPSFFDHPDSDPAKKVPAADTPANGPDILQAHVDSLTSENSALKSREDGFRAQIADLQAQVSDLQEQLNAALDSDSDDLIEPADQIKGEIEALEAKKATEGKLSPAENMKLGKLKKKLAETTSAQ